VPSSRATGTRRAPAGMVCVCVCVCVSVTDVCVSICA